MRRTKIVCTIGPASSSLEFLQRRLSLHSGILPKAIRPALNTDQVVEEMEDGLVSEGAVAPGDTLVSPPGRRCSSGERPT